MHHIHLHIIVLFTPIILNKSNKQQKKLRLGFGTLREITQNGRTGPISLKRAESRLSESIHVSLVLVRLQLASGSLKRTGHFQYSGQNLASLA